MIYSGHSALRALCGPTKRCSGGFLTPMIRRNFADNPSSSDGSSKRPDVQKPSSHNNREGSVYVHPLSQLVLQYFQANCHEWICGHKLEGTLTLHRDGSFVLEKERGNDDDPGLRIWTYYDVMDKKHWLSYTTLTADEEERRQRRFLLQDNLLPAWNAGAKRKSLPERVEDSVQELMKQVNQELPVP